MLVDALKQDKNLVTQTMACMVQFYGYKSLQQADDACRREQEG